jgi:ADP-L-glycero-D-manno-heptose 6-epimerase
MRFIVTGGAGFVGANLVRALAHQHPASQILIIDDFRSGSFANLAGPFAGINPALTGDARDADWSYQGQLIARSLSDIDLPTVIEDFRPDVVFHQASITDTTVTDQAKMIRDNVEPFATLLSLAGRLNFTLVWASSGATYGQSARGAALVPRPFTLEDAGQPANVYGFSKWLMENLHRDAQRSNPKLRVVGLRYFNVFGPGETHKLHMASMIHQLAQKMLAGKQPRIFFDGSQARDHIHVSDVVRANLAAIEPHAKPGIYNVGTGTVTTFNQIIAALNEALSSQLATDYFTNPYSFYQDYTCADISQTTAGLSWQPVTTTRDGILAYARAMRR